MTIKNKKKQINSLLLQSSNLVGQEGFLTNISTEYKKIMSLQHIHFVHLSKNGEIFFEEVNGPYDINTFVTYQHEDIWMPENNETPVTSIINQRIDKQTCQLYANNTNLYDWLLYNQKCNDALGTIHPCLSAFVCLRIEEDQLTEEEYQLHVSSSRQLMNLYYLDKRIKNGILIEDIFRKERYRMLNYPLLILDSNFQIIYDENNIESEIKFCNTDLKDILNLIKKTVLFSEPTINEFKESFKLVINSSADSIKFLIQPIVNSNSIFYLCYYEISEIQSYIFTKREIEIINLIDKGLSNKDIADRLYIATETVKKHIYNMMSKTGIRNRIALVTLYHQQLF